MFTFPKVLVLNLFNFTILTMPFKTALLSLLLDI